MKYIIRFAKPFVAVFLFALVCLSIQATCEINLPNYMSNIVNVGIQQSGIEESSPAVISEESFLIITHFMNDDEKTLVKNSYELKDGYEIADEFKNAKGKKVYVRKDDINLDEVNSAFGYGIWTMVNSLSTLNSAKVQNLSEKMIDVSILYDLKPVLLALDSDTISQARSQAQALHGSDIKTSAATFLNVIYKELGMDLRKHQQDYIVSIGFIMLIVTLLSSTMAILANFSSSRIAAGVARNTREKLFKKISSFSNTEFDKFSTSSLITRSTNDVNQIQMLLAMGIRFMFFSPIMVIGGVVMALNKSVSMAWIIALSCILLIGFLAIIMSIILPFSKRMQKLIDKLNLVTRETLNGLMVIRAFGTEKSEKEKFDKNNKDLAKTTLTMNRVMSFMNPFMTLGMNGTSVLVVWIGAHQIANSTMQVGDMMAYIQYSMQIIMSFFMMTMMFVFLPRALVSAKRIGEVLDYNVAIKDPKTPILPDKSKKGFVEFKNVAFRYLGADENAVSNINLVAKPGETLAFIGSTGSGKSTLLNLITRFYDVTEGEILVSGVNVKDLEQHKLREMIGYVPQKSILMSGTIASNIGYGQDDINDADIEKSAKIAQAFDFISEKEDGFNSHISQGGSNVSGGQRQRLSIARALAINPDIILFDDSFSALDFKTDAILRTALAENTKDMTIIIVAQRVNTILNADKIIVLDEGKIIAQGTHKELLKNCPDYYEIAATQLSKEELEYE